MSSPPTRLRQLLGHVAPSEAVATSTVPPASSTPASSTPASSTPAAAPHIHQLSPTLFLVRAAAIDPSALAIYHVDAGGNEIQRTYAEFATRTRSLAWYLQSHKLRRVGILAPNTPAFLEAIFAVGAVEHGVIVPANYRLKAEDIAYMFAHADVEVIIVDAEFAGLLDRFRDRCPNIPILIDTDNISDTKNPYAAALEEGSAVALKVNQAGAAGDGSEGWAGLHTQCADEDGMIAIPFTSGTTSRPKGVILTHRGAYMAAMANIVESGLSYDGGKRCKYLWTLPLFHVLGWTFPWAVTAVRGTHVCLRKIDYPLIWRLLKTMEITHFNAAPTVNTLLCAAKEAEKLPHPVRVTVAASPPTPHLFQQMISLNLHPVHVYGMTETYGPLTKGYYMPEWDKLPEHERYVRMARQGHGFLTSLPARVIRRRETGSSSPATELTARTAPTSAANTASPVLEDVRADGQEIGEVVFTGNVCCKGYYKDPKATAELFAGGVLHSGDLAVKHPDGSIQILDRSKDIIISGGENISSVALEAMLAEHPAILEAGVVAVPDERWGESPMAFVTLNPKVPPVTGSDIIAWAKHQSDISKFMIPCEVVIVNELPKTSTGKIKKVDLREWAKKRLSSR